VRIHYVIPPGIICVHIITIEILPLIENVQKPFPQFMNKEIKNYPLLGKVWLAG
jgi:hypothetical protein